jgi:hypothetical protein
MGFYLWQRYCTRTQDTKALFANVQKHTKLHKLQVPWKELTLIVVKESFVFQQMMVVAQESRTEHFCTAFVALLVLG